MHTVPRMHNWNMVHVLNSQDCSLTSFHLIRICLSVLENMSYSGHTNSNDSADMTVKTFLGHQTISQKVTFLW